MSKEILGIQLANEIQDITIELKADQSSDTARLLLEKMHALNAIHPNTFSLERLMQIENLIEALRVVKH
ncbi:MAG: hypothetical protein WA981_09780 [Glaciecola sp.]